MLHGFVVKADKSLLQELWMRYICNPSRDLGLPIDVRALDHVLLVFVDSRIRQFSLTLKGSEGIHREKLFAVVVPGIRAGDLVLFVPYVYASDCPGWKLEREIFGYPEQSGGIDIQFDDGDDPARLAVTAHAIRRFAPEMDATDQEILHIQKTRTLATPGTFVDALVDGVTAVQPPQRSDDAGTIIRQPRILTAADMAFFTRFFGGGQESSEPSLVPFALRAHLKWPFRMLFLKQFRDIVYSDLACYQAIVESTLNAKNASDIVQAEHVYQLNVEDFDSAPIRRELGLQANPVPVELAFRLRVGEMAFETPKVLSNPYWNPAYEVPTPSEPSRLPRYVDRGGDAVWRHPSSLTGARIYGFGVDASADRQQSMLKKYINDVAVADRNSTYGSRTFELHAASTGLDVVMLLFIEYKRITSRTDDDKRLGGTAYKEFLAMQLALSPDEQYPELNWFIPFIYLDRDAPRLGGREIFGYPKQLGTITILPENGDPDRILDTAELRATVIPNLSLKAAEPNQVVVKVRARRPPTIKKRYLSAAEAFLDLWAHVGSNSQLQTLVTAMSPELQIDNIGSPAPGVDVLNALAFSRIGNVFLKQFRDCENPNHACYQAVCKTDTVPGRFYSGGCFVPSDYEIEIKIHESDPLFEYVDDPTQAVITPKFAYWLDLDFELTNGRIIANPLQGNYAPNLSISLERPNPLSGRRRVRRSEEPENVSPVEGGR
jgi:hypothetical protein